MDANTTPSIVADLYTRSLGVLDSVRSRGSNEQPAVRSAPRFPITRAADLIGRSSAAIRDADAVLFVTPEYNGSIPGVLKNAVDWASRPTPATSALANKPVAVIGASTGMFGAAWAQAELRKALGLAGARVLDQELAVPTAHEAFREDGRLVRGATRRRLRSMLADLIAEVAPVTEAAAPSGRETPVTPQPE